MSIFYEFLVFIGLILLIQGYCYLSYQPINTEIKEDIAENQKFIEAHLLKGTFDENGFDADFIAVFAKDHVSFKASGYVANINGKLVPQIVKTWCPIYKRALSKSDVERFFESIVSSDLEFINSIQVCKPLES